MPRYEQNQNVPLDGAYVGLILHVYGGDYPTRYEVEIRREGQTVPLVYAHMVEREDGELVAHEAPAFLAKAA